MKLSSRKVDRRKTIELQMTSMIDVVFLLLIFFMTTAAFVQTERELPSNITVQEQSAAQAESNLEPAIVEIVPGTVDGGRFVYRLGRRDFADAAELESVLRQMPNKVDGAFVRATDAAPFGMAATAIQACREAGFFIVSYVPLD